MSTKYIKLLEKAKSALEDAKDALSGNGKCDRVDALDAIYYALLEINQALPDLRSVPTETAASESANEIAGQS